jgi:hypothetical protein
MDVRVVLLAVALLILAGCGGAGSGATRRPATRRAPAKVGDEQIRRGLALPARVPLRSSGRAPAQEVRVVRDWLDRLRRGDVEGAARLFAVPSRFQNISSIQIIHSLHDAELINASLPCGARLVSAGGAGGFVVYRAELTERPGGSCGAGTGDPVRGAILIRAGHIVEWYRLPDRDIGEPGSLPALTGPQL